MLGSPRSPHTVLTRKKSTYIYTHTLVNTLHIVCKNTYNIQHMFQHRSLLHRISDGERASLRSSPWRTLLDERCSTESYWIYNSAWQNTLQRGFEKERLYTSWRMKESVFWPLKSHKGWGEASWLSQPPGASFWGFSMKTGAEGGLIRQFSPVRSDSNHNDEGHHHHHQSSQSVGSNNDRLCFFRRSPVRHQKVNHPLWLYEKVAAQEKNAKHHRERQNAHDGYLDHPHDEEAPLIRSGGHEAVVCHHGGKVAAE